METCISVDQVSVGRLDIKCPECGVQMLLRKSKFGLFYGCSDFPNCKATHGAHADGTPLGIPGDRETKDARMAAHAVFDKKWRSGALGRSEAYAWLAAKLGVSKAECHIGRFDKETCQRVIEICSREGI